VDPDGSFHPKDFQINTIGSWHKFTSTSSLERVANHFSKDNQAEFKDQLLLFRIYLTGKNEPRPHI